MKCLVSLGIAAAIITVCTTAGVKTAKKVMRENDDWKKSIRPDVAAFLTNPNQE